MEYAFWNIKALHALEDVLMGLGEKNMILSVKYSQLWNYLFFLSREK